MILIVNGENLKTDAKTVYELLTKLDVVNKTMAVAINMEVVKQTEWKKHELKNHDKVELLRFVGGG